MPSPRSRWIAALLIVLMALSSLTNDLTTPALPALGLAFQAHLAETQWVFSGFLIGFSVMLLVSGPLSDRFGRRPVLLAGLALYALGGLVCWLGASLPLVVAGRVIQGLGACTGSVLARAVVRDVYDEAGSARALAKLFTVMALFPMLGNLAGGGLMDLFGARASFAVQAAIGLVSLIAVFALLAETNAQPDLQAARLGRVLAAYWQLLGNRTYRGHVAALFFIYGALFAFVVAGPFYFIRDRGTSPTLYGAYFLIVMTGYMAGSYLSGRLVARLGIPNALAACVVLAMTGSVVGLALALAGIASAPAVLAPTFLICAATGLVMPVAFAGAIGPFPEKAGTASSGAGFAQVASGVVISVLVGKLHDGTALPMMAMMLGCALLAALTWALWVRPRR